MLSDWKKRELRFKEGLLPGDFMVTLQFKGICLGVAGLNSTFLHFGDQDEGSLAVEPEQLPEELPAWVRQHEATLLLAHHPPRWLHHDRERAFFQGMHTANHFVAFLFGHMHESRSWTSTGVGDRERHLEQAASLFGLEKWGTKEETRATGYNWGRLSRQGPDMGLLERWYREGALVHGMDLVIDRAHGTKEPETKKVTLRAPCCSPEGFDTQALQNDESLTPAGNRITSIQIPAGNLFMGASFGGEGWAADAPEHRVVLTRPFLMMHVPVTQALWDELMPHNPSEFREDCRPVNNVSWFDAIAMANALSDATGLDKAYELFEEKGTPGTHSYSFKKVFWKGFDSPGWRLPIEAEWEYACRAGSSKARYGPLNDVAWYEVNSDQQTHPVGQKLPNAWGLFDMLGNVWEWCWDWFDTYEEGDATNPRGPQIGYSRVVRGGSWADKNMYIWANIRHDWQPDSCRSPLGFRLVRTVLLERDVPRTSQ